MKLTKTIFVFMCSLSFSQVYANSNIYILKSNSINDISDIKKEFLSIKNRITSPFNKKQFPNESFLDSLKFLSQKLDAQRKNMFSSLIGLDLENEDIQFFDNLNKESVLLYNIINGYGEICHSYLNYGNSNKDYSFEQYALEMRKLLILKQKLFKKKIHANNGHLDSLIKME